MLCLMSRILMMTSCKGMVFHERFSKEFRRVQGLLHRAIGLACSFWMLGIGSKSKCFFAVALIDTTRSKRNGGAEPAKQEAPTVFLRSALLFSFTSSLLVPCCSLVHISKQPLIPSINNESSTTTNNCHHYVHSRKRQSCDVNWE